VAPASGKFSSITVMPALHHGDITAWFTSPGNRKWKAEEMDKNPCFLFMERAVLSQEVTPTGFAFGLSC